MTVEALQEMFFACVLLSNLSARAWSLPLAMGPKAESRMTASREVPEFCHRRNDLLRGFVRDAAQDKFLCEIRRGPLPGANQKIP